MADETIPETKTMTAEELLALEQKAQIEALSTKLAEYPDFSSMSDSEKLNILLAEKISELEAADIEMKQREFYVARDAALESHRLAGLEQLDTLRVQIYKEKLDLEAEWNAAAQTGTWDVPQGK